MKIKPAILRLRGHTAELVSPPDWRVAPLPAVREAIAAALDGHRVATPAAAREAVAAYYAGRGVTIAPEEVALGVGTRDLYGLLAAGNLVAFSSPGDPALLRRVVGDGLTGGWRDGFYLGVEYLEGVDEAGFKSTLPLHSPTWVEIASPASATGVVFSERELLRWVRYAAQTGMTICYAADLGAYARTAPSTILGVDGAQSVALESVNLAPQGIAGLCYTVIPESWEADWAEGKSSPAAAAARAYLGEPAVSPLLLSGLVALYSETGVAQWEAYRTAVAEKVGAAARVLDEAEVSYWGGVEAPLLWLEKTALTPVLRDELSALGGEYIDGIHYGPFGADYVQIRFYVAANADLEIIR